MLYFNNPYNKGYSVCISCPYAAGCAYTMNNFMRSDNMNGSLGKVDLEEQKLRPNQFSIAYPLVSNPNNSSVISKINEAIINEVNNLFKEQVLRPEPTDIVDVNGTYEVMVNHKGILSILFSMYTYVDRAAHGYTAYSSLTINTEMGQIYSFKDLFNPKFNYVPFINELAQQYIKDNDILLIEDYNGITENQQFYLTPKSLVLYYQLYEYTPYAYGLFKIEIPYTMIGNLIYPLSPIAKLIR